MNRRWFSTDFHNILSVFAPCPILISVRCWGLAGSSWAAVVETRDGLHYPADLYLEGSDQHRGWFQSSLLTSVASKGEANFRLWKLFFPSCQPIGFRLAHIHIQPHVWTLSSSCVSASLSMDYMPMQAERLTSELWPTDSCWTRRVSKWVNLQEMWWIPEQLSKEGKIRRYCESQRKIFLHLPICEYVLNNAPSVPTYWTHLIYF